MNRLTTDGGYFKISDDLAIKGSKVGGYIQAKEYNALSIRFDIVLDKLSKYEDTGLEPEEIGTDEELFKSYRHVCGGRRPEEIERALYLLDLEEQGRLIKLRCKVGDMVYKLEDYGEWQDNPHTFIPIKCQVELIFLGDDNKVYCDLVSIDDFFQVGDKFEEIPINEIYLSKEAAEKASECNNG